MPRSRGSSGRSRSGGLGGFGFGKKPAAPARPAARPAPARRQEAAPRPAGIGAPPAAGGGGGMMSGLGSTIAQGMAFGTGSAIAHRAVGAIAGSMGGGSEAPATSATESGAPVAAAAVPAYDCSREMTEFNKCLFENNNQIASCQWNFDMLRQCQTEHAT